MKLIKISPSSFFWHSTSFLLIWITMLSFTSNLFSQKIDYETIRSGEVISYRDEDKIQKVITSRDMFEKIWVDMFINWFPQPKLPNVDFGQEIIIFLMMDNDSLGSRSRIENLKITDENQNILVSYLEITPGLGCIISTRRPYKFIRVSNLKKEVIFETKQKSEDCLSFIN